MEALAAHRQVQQRERDRSAYWEDHGLVFTTVIGTPIDPRNLLRSFYALCDDARVRRIRFHDLRHTCASLLLTQGVEPRVIMDVLGHSTIGTTLNLYAHVLPAMQRDAAARMDSLLR